VTPNDQVFVALIGRLLALRLAQAKLLESILECGQAANNKHSELSCSKLVRDSIDRETINKANV